MRASATKEIGIGGRLRAARQRLGWSRETLAFHSGVSWSAIAQVESGRRRHLRPSTLSSLARALGITIDYLVEGRPSSAPMLDHRALLYETDSEFVDTVAPFLLEGLEHAEAAIAVTTEANVELLRDRLGEDSRRVEFAECSRWYRTPRVALDRYRAFLSSSLDAGAPWVRIVGGPVWAGRSESEIRLWERYESLINLVFSAEPATVLCPYDTRAVDGEITRQACVTHPAVLGCEKLPGGSLYAEPAEFVLGR